MECCALRSTASLGGGATEDRRDGLAYLGRTGPKQADHFVHRYLSSHRQILPRPSPCPDGVTVRRARGNEELPEWSVDWFGVTAVAIMERSAILS
jgi:hypothetical protein